MRPARAWRLARSGGRRYSIRTAGVKAGCCGIASLISVPSLGTRDRRKQPMPGAGTDKTKNWIAAPGPVVILVEPQLGDNVGAAARAMANFGLSRLRLVKPRDGWPNPRAWVAASGADRVLDQAELFDTLEAAIADCSFVLAA